MFSFGKKTLLAAALAFGLSMGISANDAPRKIVVIGDEISAAPGENSWLKQLAQTGGDVVNALRPQWRSAETWYVREVLGEYPDADFVLLISASELTALKHFDTDELHRISARAGYMIDLIHEKNPQADIVLVAPPAAGNNLTAMSAEILAIGLEKIARQRDAKFISFLDAITPVKDHVYPHDQAAQKKIAALINDELAAPKFSERQPLAADAGLVAPPPAGYAIASKKDASELAQAVAADFSMLKPTKSADAKQTKSPQLAQGKVSDFVSDRDLAGIMSEEGLMLAGGIAGAINEFVGEELAARETAQMEKMFAQKGADTFAQIDFEPPLAVGEISAIVPPEGAAKTLRDQVNEVRIAEVPTLTAEELVDNVDVPGLLEFDRDPVLASATVIRPTVRDTPTQNMADAPWNRVNEPRQVEAVVETVPEIVLETVAEISAEKAQKYPLPEVEFADADGAENSPKVEAIYQGATVAAATYSTGSTGEIPLAKLKDPNVRAYVSAIQSVQSEVELASAQPRRRWANAERYLTPTQTLIATPGYAVYIHTSPE